MLRLTGPTEMGVEQVNAATQGFRLRFAIMALAVTGALAGILLFASAGPVEQAHAQSTAACPEYVSGCGGNGGGGCQETNTCGGTNPGNNQGENNQGENNIQGGAAGTTGGNGGELPFTGYPLTPLLLLLLLLLAAGLAIRAYLAVRGRMRSRHAGDGQGPTDIG